MERMDADALIPSAALPDITADETALQLDPEIWATLRHLMWTRGGIIRSARGLLGGLTELAPLYRNTPREHVLLRGRLFLVRALLTAAWQRKKSCGAHLREDTPSHAVDSPLRGRQPSFHGCRKLCFRHASL